MPSSGTTKHSIRIEQDLWAAYLKICKAEGTNCAQDLREHIRRRVEEYEQNTDAAD